MYTHTHEYMNVFAHIYTGIHIYICTHIHMHIYTHTCTHTYIRMHMHTYVQIENLSIDASTCQAISKTHIRIHIHMHAYTHIYAYTRMCTTCSECVRRCVCWCQKKHLCNIHTCPCTGALFLASTVSALHRNAHICHLLLLSHCELTQHGGQEKNSFAYVRLRESNKGRLWIQSMCLPTVLSDQSYPMGRTVSLKNADWFKLQITTFAENGKIQLTPKITNHLFTCYLNCMCKSDPVCSIQQ